MTSIDLLEKAGISGFMGDSGPGNQVNDWMFKTGARIPTVRAAWKTRLMEVYLAGANSMPKDFEDYEAVTEMFKAMNKAADHEGLSYIVVRMTEPIFDQFTNAIKKERSSWNVLAQARTAAEIKLKTGRYPQSLPISGRTAEDVIVAGSLLKFDASAGFKVWSIGANKTDDDGVFDALVKKDDFSVILKN